MMICIIHQGNRNDIHSQGATGTISRGNFILALYCAFRPNKYNSVCWTHSNFLWAPANTFFF